MFGLIVVIILGYIGYRYSKRGTPRKEPGWRFSGPVYAPSSSMPTTRAQQRGETGEAVVDANCDACLRGCAAMISTFMQERC